MDRWLLAVPNGIESSPAVTSQMSDYDGPREWYAGPWPATRNITLFAQEDRADPDYRWKLLPTQPGKGPKTAATFVSTGTNTEAGANANPRLNDGWFWFETPALARDARVFGEIKVRLWSTIQRRWITYTPTIVDIDPSKRVIGPGQLLATDERGLISATRGWLDSRYRTTLAAPSDVAPGTSFGMTVVEKPQDYTFAKGHLIGLNVQTEILEWSLPKPYPECTGVPCSTVRIDWEAGQTRVTLPVVGAPANARDLFVPGG
jgi:predicted acyl esterase